MSNLKNRKKLKIHIGDKMNITVVCDVLGEETNGTTLAAMNLIRFLQSQNHNVQILCADVTKKGVNNYHVVPTLSLWPFDKIVEKNNVVLAKPKDDIIEKALEGADHVHIMLPFALGRRALKIAKQKGLPVSAGFHAQAENVSCHFRLQNSRLFNKLVYKNFYNHFYKYVDAIHYPTQFVRDEFEKELKVKTNGYVISNGVNDYVFKKQVEKPEALKNKFVILTTGRYSVEKAQWQLIKAVKYSKYKDKIKLILAGQGPLEKKFKHIAKKENVDAIFGVYERSEMVNVINYSDLYVHTAEFELEGIACLEAICCGKMVVVCDSKKSATPNFVIDDKCKFKPDNPKELAKVIDYWIEHEDERKRYEELYLQKASEYNQHECMKKMEQMILDLQQKK